VAGEGPVDKDSSISCLKKGFIQCNVAGGVQINTSQAILGRPRRDAVFLWFFFKVLKFAGLSL
jgi:hypothetical protein